MYLSIVPQTHPSIQITFYCSPDISESLYVARTMHRTLVGCVVASQATGTGVQTQIALDAVQMVCVLRRAR